ncbi:hypothetical protein [Synechococcus sp. HK01-R]|nr:hypothetical protein [Synechococcus sp. HK01-R]
MILRSLGTRISLYGLVGIVATAGHASVLIGLGRAPDQGEL